MIDDRFRLFPEQASTQAHSVDPLFFVLVGLSAVITILVAALIVYFSIKYRRGNALADLEEKEPVRRRRGAAHLARLRVRENAKVIKAL